MSFHQYFLHTQHHREDDQPLYSTRRLPDDILIGDGDDIDMQSNSIYKTSADLNTVALDFGALSLADRIHDSSDYVSNNNFENIFPLHRQFDADHEERSKVTQLSSTERAATRSIPIPFQRNNYDHNENRYRAYGEFCEDSSDDDDVMQSKIDDEGEGESNEGDTNKNILQTVGEEYSQSIASSARNHVTNSEQNVAQSLPSRLALLRAPYLGSRKTSPTILDDDEDDDTNWEPNINSLADSTVKRGSKLVLPPPQQSLFENDQMSNLVPHSITKSSAYGSLRESQLEGRFIQNPHLRQEQFTLQHASIQDYQYRNANNTTVMAASAPLQLSIGERMHKSMILQNQKLAQQRSDLKAASNEVQHDLKNSIPSGRTELKSLLGEMLSEAEHVDESKNPESILLQPATTGTDYVSNKLVAKLVTDGDNQLDLSLSDLDNLDKKPHPSNPVISSDVSRSFSLNQAGFDVSSNESHKYSLGPNGSQESSNLSRSLTGLEILKQLGSQKCDTLSRIASSGKESFIAQTSAAVKPRNDSLIATSWKIDYLQQIPPMDLRAPSYSQQHFLAGTNGLSHSSIIAISSKLPTQIGLVHPNNNIVPTKIIATIEQSHDESESPNDSHQFEQSAAPCFDPNNGFGTTEKIYEGNENWITDDDNPDVEGAFDLDF